MPPACLARLAVLNDRISEGELHLLLLVPLAWLREDMELAFVNSPTEFGPVSITARLRDGAKTLIVSLEPLHFRFSVFSAFAFQKALRRMM